ncbi:hypothetical protein ABT025_28680 [Streptomyces sp. NPDC002809]|uniref:hypothetical protein n=1 Tax=Streptomyces sp. NPDC002809 TaxID=3154433 RepID=UPI003333058D
MADLLLRQPGRSGSLSRMPWWGAMPEEVRADRPPSGLAACRALRITFGNRWTGRC